MRHFAILIFPMIVMLFALDPSTSAVPIDSEETANRATAEFISHEPGALSNEELCDLAHVYNELHEDKKAFDTLNSVPESYLAKNNKLGAKFIYYHNMLNKPDAAAYHVGHLAFIQRCIDKHYGQRRIWLFYKASILCRTSVKSPEAGPEKDAQPVISDRNQYEYAFETLKQAAETRPVKGITGPNMSTPDSFHAREWFPVMHKEARFEKVFEKFHATD